MVIVDADGSSLTGGLMAQVGWLGLRVGSQWTRITPALAMVRWWHCKHCHGIIVVVMLLLERLHIV